jgi:site-specific DNA recombinase
MRAALYARFSSDLQRDTSIDDQLMVCRRYADAHGWMIHEEHVYTDAAISGTSLDRPGIQRLRAATELRIPPIVITSSKPS